MVRIQIRIGCTGIKETVPIYKHLEILMPPDVQLVYLEGVFDELKKQAVQAERKNAVDVFVCSGSNAVVLQENTSIPTVIVQPSELEILVKLKQAANCSNVRKVGFITYREPFPPIRELAKFSEINIIERVFYDEKTLKEVLLAFKQEKIYDIIGGHLASVLARELGMRGYPNTSEDNFRQALFYAIDIARAKKKEMIKAQQWSTILESAYDAIISTDEHGIITLFNSKAQDILGIQADEAIGKNAAKVLFNKMHEQAMKTRIPQVQKICDYGGVQVIASCIPIIMNKEVSGVVITFQTLGEVQKSEQKIRRKQIKSGFVAQKEFFDIQGESTCIKNVKKIAMQYADTNATILIHGETGTGKELFAQALHNASPRRKMPFVSVNCAALPISLLESELFGYEEGAFTGARRGGKYGLFELAHTGTIFLDEIAEAPLDIQARLLRVLEEKQLLRIGGEKVINVDVRIIAATNKDLCAMAEAGTFRKDLYYRVNVLELNIPPLRQRREDIPVLLEAFLSDMRPDLSAAEIRRIAAHRSLFSFSWPGNIRQLRNVAERIAVIYKSGVQIGKFLGEIGIPQTGCVEAYDPKFIEETLKRFGGNKKKAAASLGISRTTLWRKVKETD